MSQVLSWDGFVSEATCRGLVEQFRAKRDKGSDYVNRTMLDAIHLDAVNPMLDDCVTQLNEFYGTAVEREWSVLTEMREGDSQPEHADAEQLNGDPNHTPWRTHVALLYLTDGERDHTGGVLRLPALGLEYVAKPGLLVGFPATAEYGHEVTLVESGTRYALATWTRKGDSP